MTLDEVREICKQAKWTREIPLVDLFNNLVDVIKKRNDGKDSKAQRAFHGYEGQATGLIVSIILTMRRDEKLPIYELSK